MFSFLLLHYWLHKNTQIKKWSAIKDINVDQLVILVCGGFNCVLKNDSDIISGEKHVERVVLKFYDLLSDCDLHDTWRLFPPGGKEYTCCKKKIHLLLED